MRTSSFSSRRSGGVTRSGGPRVARQVGLHARPRRRLSKWPRACPCSPPGRRSALACRALCLLDRSQPPLPRQNRPCDRLVRSRTAAAGAPRARLRGARLSADPFVAGADGLGGDFEAGLRNGGRGGRDRRTFWRRRPGLARRGRAGPGPGQPRASRRRGWRWWTKSWWSRRGRSFSDHHGHRLLQHDRVLSERVRAAPRPGVDGRPDEVVRAASPKWSLTTGYASSIVRRSCSCRARGEMQWTRRAGPPSISRRECLNQLACGQLSTDRGRSIACGASSTAAEDAYREASRLRVASHSRVSPSCDWPKARAMPRPPRFVGRSSEATSLCSVPLSSPRTSRSCSRSTR